MAVRREPPREAVEDVELELRRLVMWVRVRSTDPPTGPLCELPLLLGVPPAEALAAVWETLDEVGLREAAERHLERQARAAGGRW